MASTASKLRILFTIPNFDTAGSGKALLNIAKNLNGREFESHICCSHNRGDFFKEVKKAAIPIHIHQTTHEMIPRFNGIKNSIKLAKYFRSYDFDLIHSFHYGPDYSEALAAKIAGIPWVYTKKNMNWGGLSKNGWKLRSFFAKHILIQNSDMLDLFFPNSSKVSLVPRGVDTTEFKPRVKNKKTMKYHNIDEKDRILLCVANLHPVKGVEVLIKAFEVLENRYNNLQLIIVGEKNNDYGEALEIMAKKSSVSEKIHFTGRVKNVIEYYSIADLFILPTQNIGRREGCPVALLEALASGLNVIAGNVSGIKDILKGFPNNLFQSNNIDQLCKKIELNLGDSTIQKELFKHVQQNYNIDIEVEKHKIVYRKILEFPK